MESTKPKKQKPEPGPEQPLDPNQAGVSYLSFDELPCLSDEQLNSLNDLFLMMHTNAKIEEDWKA